MSRCFSDKRPSELVSSQQISIGDFTFLQQFLNGNLRGWIGRGCNLRAGGDFKLNDQPVGLRDPFNAGAGSFLTARQIQFHFVLATFNVRKNPLRIYLEKIAEQIQPADFAQLQRVQALSRYRANHQNSPTALGNQQGLIERIEKPSDQPQGHVTVGLRLR
jgi:hypothetical protein